MQASFYDNLIILKTIFHYDLYRYLESALLAKIFDYATGGFLSSTKFLPMIAYQSQIVRCVGLRF